MDYVLCTVKTHRTLYLKLRFCRKLHLNVLFFAKQERNHINFLNLYLGLRTRKITAILVEIPTCNSIYCGVVHNFGTYTSRKIAERKKGKHQNKIK